MNFRSVTKLLLLGFLSWLIPFVISFLFYRPGGELVVPYATFKSIIVTVGSLSGCLLLYQYFKPVKEVFVRHGYISGMTWLMINILLDTIVLIPMMKTSFADYLSTIGISYLNIPAISITMGYLLNLKNRNN